jgi:hypothetical protein
MAKKQGNRFFMVQSEKKYPDKFNSAHHTVFTCSHKQPPSKAVKKHGKLEKTKIVYNSGINVFP